MYICLYYELLRTILWTNHSYLKDLKILLKSKDDIYHTTIISRVLPICSPLQLPPLLCVENIVLWALILIGKYRTASELYICYMLLFADNLYTAPSGTEYNQSLPYKQQVKIYSVRHCSSMVRSSFFMVLL